MNTGTPEWKAIHIPLVAPVEVIMLLKRRENIIFSCIHNESKFRTNKQVCNNCLEIYLWVSCGVIAEKRIGWGHVAFYWTRNDDYKHTIVY